MVKASVSTKKKTVTEKTSPAVTVTSAPNTAGETENLGELMHKLIAPGEVEIQLRKGTAKKETIYMRSISYLDRIVMDTHLDYVKRECEKMVDLQGQAQALIATRMVDILYLSLHRKLKDGKLVRRFASLEEAGTFLTADEITKLTKLYGEHLQLSNAEKKE